MSSKHAQKEIEPAVIGSLIAAESTLDDARNDAYGAPSLNIKDNTWWTGKPQSIEIDRDKDGKSDALASIDYTIFGNLDNIKVSNIATGKTEYTLKANRAFGYVIKLRGDLDGDGKEEFTATASRGAFSGNVFALKIDHDGDGKSGAKVSISHGWFTGKMNTLDWDKDNDGKTDTTFTVNRGSFSGYLSTVNEKKK